MTSRVPPMKDVGETLGGQYSLSRRVIVASPPGSAQEFTSTTLYHLHARKMGGMAPVEPMSPIPSEDVAVPWTTSEMILEGETSVDQEEYALQRLPTDHMVSFCSLPASMQPPTPREHTAVQLFRYLHHYIDNKMVHTIPITEFGKMVAGAASLVYDALDNKPMHVEIPAPVYVFGDIHGNVQDLHYFYKQLVPFNDLSYCSSHFLFLGDYVDRGDYAVEVIAYLCALKLLDPNKVTMIRGNHEDEAVNKDHVYGASGFFAQCLRKFGSIPGAEVYNACKTMFSRLPLCATINKKIFAVHGGIPRNPDCLAVLADPKFPRFHTLFPSPTAPSSQFEAMCRSMAMDMCWADPSEDDVGLDANGFGPNPRGGSLISFGSKAVDDFMARHKFEFILRAHQEKADGLKVSKNSRVLTIFSSSDYNGHANGAGLVFVSMDNKIRFVVKDA